MQLFPYETFTILAPQTLETVVSRLETQIEAPRLRWGRDRKHAPYAGTISPTGFEIHRIIHYRNSVRPNIRGRFEARPDGTRVRIAMKLHPFVAIFLFFWCSLWYGISIPVFLSGARSGDLSPEVGLFLGLPVVVLFVFWCAFWYEVKRSRRELTAIVLGKSLEPATGGTPGSKILAVLTIAAIFVGNLFVFQTFWSPSPPAARPCSQAPSVSPYCNISLVRTITGHPTATAIAASTDGNILVTGGTEKAIKVWDLQTGELKRMLQSDSGIINALAIAPNNQTVVSGSGDRMVRIWDAMSDRPPQMLKGHSSNILQVEVSDDGRTVVSSSYNEIKIWDLATGELKTTFPDPSPKEIQIGPLTIEDNSPSFRVLHLSSNGKTALVERGSKLVVLDLATHHEQMSISTSWFASTNAARVSLDGQTIVTTSYTQPQTTLKIWDLAAGKLKAKGILSAARESWGYGDRLALSRDRIFAATPQGIQVWNPQTARQEALLDTPSLHKLKVSPDGKLLVGMVGDGYSKNAQIQVWQRSVDSSSLSTLSPPSTLSLKDRPWIR